MRLTHHDPPLLYIYLSDGAPLTKHLKTRSPVRSHPGFVSIESLHQTASGEAHRLGRCGRHRLSSGETDMEKIGEITMDDG